MAQNRPEKPQITLPDDFGGTQSPFSSSLVENGYEASIPQIIEGGNLNWMLNGFFQNTKYMRTVLDYVRDTPIGKMFWVNSQGQMDYIQPSVIATDEEFSTGTATDKTPNVKQVVDKFATKSDDNTVVKLTGNQTITGVKTFKGDNRITVLQNSTVTYNTAPSSDTFTDLSIRDKNGVEMGVLEHVRYTNNDTGLRLVAKGIDGNWSNSIAVGKKADGTTYTSAPTPTAGDNSTNIATTAFVKTAVSNVLASLYPVGSIYIGTQSTCPLASLISGSQWQLVAQDRALWGGNGSNANSTINAGLPNIWGAYNVQCLMNWGDLYERGSLYRGNVDNSQNPQNAGGTSGGNPYTITVDASRSSSIYGASSTVQPPAYRVNVWRRTA